MEAVLRFARGDSGATAVAHTSELREDLPVVGETQAVESWSDSAKHSPHLPAAQWGVHHRRRVRARLSDDTAGATCPLGAHRCWLSGRREQR